MHEIDRAMKMLLSQFPEVFLRLLFKEEEHVSLIGLEDTQLNVPEHRSDKIFHVKNKNSEALLNFEFMLQPKRRELRNFLLKTAMLIANYPFPIITIIVYLEKGNYKLFPVQFSERFLKFQNQFTFEKLLLWEFKDQIETGELIELAPLLPLFYQNPEVELLEKERDLIDRIPDQQKRSDLVALSLMVAFRKYDQDFVINFFRKEYKMLRESKIGQELIEEGIQQGIQQGLEQGLERGIEQGIEQGIEEGIEVGKLVLLLHLIKNKFGNLSPMLEAKLNQLKDPQIEALSIKLFTMENISELTEWLEKNKHHLK